MRRLAVMTLIYISQGLLVLASILDKFYCFDKVMETGPISKIDEKSFDFDIKKNEPILLGFGGMDPPPV